MSVIPTLSRENFMFQKFGLVDKTSILEYLGEDLKKWASMKSSLEWCTEGQWYNVLATILVQLVWKVEHNVLIFFLCFFQYVYMP